MKTTPTHSSEEKATPISRTGSGWISISNLACLLAIAAVPAHAQTNSQTWDGGGGDNNWSTAANWTNDTVPINQFVDFAGTTRTNPNNDIAAGKYIYEMRLKNTTSGQSFTLDGNSVFVHNAVRTYDVASGNITDVINMNIDTLNGHWVTGTNHDLTMNGLAGSGSDVLIKSGGGTLTLAGANTYTGATTVNAGTLKLGNNSALGTTAGATTVSSGAALDTAGFNPNSGENFTISGTGTDGAGGTGALYSTANTTSFGGDTTITLAGDTEIGGGGGRIDNTATIDGGGFNLTKVGTENWYNWSGNASNIDTLIVDTGAFMGLPNAALANAASNGVQVKENATVQTWASGQNFTTNWTFENGSKFTNDWNAANASTHEISGDITLNGLVQFGANSNLGVNRVTTLSGAIGGAGALLKTGLHELVLTGDNSFTGDTLINAGTLKISGSGQLGSGSYAGAISNSGVFEYNSSATQTLSGVISGGGELAVGAGTLILTNSSTASSYNIASGAALELSSGASLTANTTFTGTGTLNVVGNISLGSIGATFSMGSGAYIDVKSGGQIVSNGGNDPWTGSLADVNVDGWLYVANNNLNVDALTGSGLVNMGTSTIVVGLDDGSGTFDGNVRSSYNEAHFRKEGSGTQTLNGELKLDKDAGLGSVTVNEGTLIINGDATGTTGAWTVNAGATLTGSGSLGGTTTIGDGATLSPGNSPGTQTFDNLTWVNGGTYLWEINADLASGGGEGVDSGWDWIDVTNTFDLSGITTGFNIDITSLTTGNIAGLADGFDYSGKSYLDPYESFTILSFGSLTGDFDASEFNLLTGNFANPKVDWSLELSGNDLVLNAVFVPEPSSTALLGLGGLALMLRRKRS